MRDLGVTIRINILKFTINVQKLLRDNRGPIYPKNLIHCFVFYSFLGYLSKKALLLLFSFWSSTLLHSHKLVKKCSASLLGSISACRTVAGNGAYVLKDRSNLFYISLDWF